MTVDRERLKARAAAEVEAHRQELIDLSLRIHDNPELGLQEERASAWLCEYLEKQGFQVERGICGLPTAFRATAGQGEPRIAFLAEYDALPGVGHACGHNIIGVSAVAAGLGARSVLDSTGGSVVVMGTPAEEIAGGKVIMARQGAFDGLDAAMLTHPGSRNAVHSRALACASLEVEYFGKEAHAAARPEAGVNALDALILAYNAIGALRQHIRDSARIHGVITDGGQAANVVPNHSAASFMVRARDDAYLEELKAKVIACFEAGARASGARLEYRWSENQFAAMKTNGPLAEAHKANLATLSRETRDQPSRAIGSTDMGNVSALVPAIHPTIAVAPPEVGIHSREFAACAASEDGHRGLLDAAKAMAMTAIDVLTDPDLRRRIQEEFLASPDGYTEELSGHP
jgi:amidohydrolase